MKTLKSPLVGTSFMLLLILTLTACNSGSDSSTPTPGIGTTSSGSSLSTTTPGIRLGVQPCPEVVNTPSHWDPIIPTQSGISKVETVSCGNLIGDSSLQALVTVRYDGTGAILDVYVYTNLTNASPTQIFKLQNLYKGDARISHHNTILTGEVDQDSYINRNQAHTAFTEDLFREFQWTGGTSTLVQVSFPGIYPDLTRFEAETDQAQVNQGQDAWKLSATQTAAALAVHLLHWSASASATLVSGGGKHDVDAVVNVRGVDPGAGTITVTLGRLDGNTNGGIWEATKVTSTGMSITSPQSRDRVTNAVRVTGTGNAVYGVIGTVKVLDHLYYDIGYALARPNKSNNAFSTDVTNRATFHGTQEGLIALLAANSSSNVPAGAVMLKELISG